jgi:hypothetical protein
VDTVYPHVLAWQQDELVCAGAFRVYRDAAELSRSLDELGISP